MFLDLLSSYINDRCQAVIHENYFSDYKNVNIGIPQGSVLGPLLFILYVNDIADYINSKKITLYADDLAYVNYNLNNRGLTDDINSDLCNLDRWLKNNRLCLNYGKTV